MEKQKNSLLICIILFLMLFIANIILFAVNIFALWLFAVISVVLLAIIIFDILLLKRVINKIKITKEKLKENSSSGDYMTDLYDILGIPVQYNEDGTVKNIYELLGIEPIYDDKGNRVLTIYELLQIMPKFNNNGDEIPSVVSIKNRVNKIAKVDVSSRVLTRKLSEEEKERLAIIEALKQKLKEAEVLGDTKKQEAISKVINAQKDGKNDKKGSDKGKGGSSPKYIIKEKINNVSSGKVRSGVDPSKLFDTSPPKIKGEGEKKVSPKNPTITTAPIDVSGKIDQKTKKVNVEDDRRKYIIVNIEEERNL